MEVCERSECLNVMNKANYRDILKVCLVSQVANIANITHKVCHSIDTAKALHNSGQGHTGTVNAGVFVFPYDYYSGY